MIKALSSLQDLRRRMYHKAKSEKTHRFWGLFVHVAKLDTLTEAYQQANGMVEPLGSMAAPLRTLRPKGWSTS